MALTRAQRKLLRETEEIAARTKLNYQSVEEEYPEWRIPRLRIAINHMVIAEDVTSYTLLDEFLSEVIIRYFFKERRKSMHFGNLWRTKKFKTFTHHILDEMYLLKKMEIVHAIKPLPKEVTKFVQKLNALRNAFAHSFFPENRKEYRKHKKVLWNDKDIRTLEGLESFQDDWQAASTYIARLSYRKWRDDYDDYDEPDEDGTKLGLNGNAPGN